MRKSPIFLTFALSLGVSFAATAHAQSGTTSSGSALGSGGAAPNAQSGAPPQARPSQDAQSRPGGRQFGEHVSGMAPEHPKMHGRLFGECVSELAITGECSHHPDEE